MKMKHVSNTASALALILVLATYVLNAAGVCNVCMEEAFRTALFIKGSFVQIDVSCWINAFKGRL
ncbi:hypothetical protein [Treponema sp. C6A8]|uniref:hypothetical protein n=1 Tax=Treponema sp. C6A8 TaxID=1410609 RepID=UPI000481ACA9|nr:hypothetical protein [Treponema sp. C6A8]